MYRRPAVPLFQPRRSTCWKSRDIRDITGHVRADGPWGHVQLAGVARWVTFDTPTGIGGNPSGTVFGYGGNLTASIKTFGDNFIKGQIAIRQGDRDLQQRLLL